MLRNSLPASRSSRSSFSFRAASSVGFWTRRDSRRALSLDAKGPDMLKTEKLSVSYGPLQALSELDLEIDGDGVLHGVIGPNGAGKSSLLDAVCGRRPGPFAIAAKTSLGGRWRGDDATAWRDPSSAPASFRTSRSTSSCASSPSISGTD